MFPLLILFALPALATLGRTPPMGWNTWKTCGDDACSHDACSEAEIKDVALAMQTNGMQALGYNYINLDDCWGGPRASNGSYTWDASRFPSGIPALADWLHQKGFLFGLYTSAGNQTCSSGGRPFKVPGSRGHYDEDAKSFASWGVDYVKFDWCGDIKDEIWLGPDAHRNFSKAVRAAGREMFLEAVAGYFFLLDTAPRYLNAWRFCEDHHDDWKSTLEAIVCRLDLLPEARGGPGAWAHMDFLNIGGEGCSTDRHCPGQTDAEYRTSFAIWSITQSPLIVDTDVRQLTPIMSETLLNAEIIEIHQSTVTAPGRLLATDLNGQFWGRNITVNGSEWMVLITNLHNSTKEFEAPFGLFGWSSTTSAKVRDLWKQADFPDPAVGQVQAKVAAHDTVALKLTKIS
jgi:alpha-galactosidase